VSDLLSISEVFFKKLSANENQANLDYTVLDPEPVIMDDLILTVHPNCMPSLEGVCPNK